MPYPYYQYPYYYNQSQSYSSNYKSIEWVDGEVGAKAFQIPQGLPPETPIALWDNSEKRIWLKSWNAMGMPNQMQELTYEIKERTNPALLPGNISGDMNQFATKEDLDHLKKEIQKLSRTISENRGGEK